ncbi:MAG TPA: DUF692 domain-containing protein [Candidatus Limnocylindrales bacterium]|nr:DUF692 domain-containing protein [Candidatus Limnocylindrales bacterium]
MGSQTVTCGVGVLFNPALADFVTEHEEALDYLAVIPDRFWIDNGTGAPSRFEETAAGEAVLASASLSLPVVLHGIGLSICSAEMFDEQYLLQLARWRKRYNSPWVSEHLSFSRIGAGHETNAGVALPVPYDREILNLLQPRIEAARDILGCPFLLENNVSYFAFPEEDLTEPEFLNELARRSGCHLLLDLHNVYTNSRNHGFDATAFLDSLDLSRVIEMHVAGGSEMMGCYTDSHTGPVAEPVWDLLSYAAPRCPNLRGVTFEFHESTWPLLRTEGVLRQLARARDVLAVAAAAA